MKPKTNKTLLVFLFSCIVLFNPAQAVCVPRNHSLSEASSSPDSTPESKPPPSPPRPSTGSAPVPPSLPKSKPPPSSPSTSSAPTPSTKQQETTDPSLPKISFGVGTAGKFVTDPQIKSLCEKTDHPDLCLDIIAPFLDGNSELTSVIEKLIKASTVEVKKAIATCDKMANDPTFSDIASKFSACKEMYDDALDNLQEATDAIPEKDIGTVQTMLSATISDFGTCDDGFTGQPDPTSDAVSPMYDVNQHLMNVSDIILALVSKIP